MITITYNAVDYTFKQVDPTVTVTTSFTNARWLNAGNKFSAQLSRPACWIDGWPDFLNLIVGKTVTIAGLLDNPVEVFVSSESTSGTYYLGLVCYSLAHDTRGQV